MIKKGLILVFLLILISGCATQSVKEKCSKDDDCVKAGCSSQLCVLEEEADGLFTTCEYKEEYRCLEFTECGCSNNNCAWKQNEDYLNCLEEVKG